jgi:hypothetical protein
MKNRSSIVNVSKSLMFAALALTLVVLPAMAQNENRKPTSGSAPTVTEVSQNTPGVTTTTTTANPDISIPGKVGLPATIPPPTRILGTNGGDRGR